MNSILAGSFLLVGLLSLTFLAWRFLNEKAYYKGLVVIIFIGLFLRIYAASDPFLHAWDERYHALVAKNMIEHPLKPTLHEHPLLDFDNNNWVGSNIWLAKPIFPLLIMSSSISLFGANLFAVRFGSILLGLLAIGLTFLIGRRLFGQQVGYIAAFLHAIHGSLLELSGGRISSDHVELCFVVMVELSVYFLLHRFQRDGRDHFIFIAGIFMGLAFLSKWYPALIVMPIWALFYATYVGKRVGLFFKQLVLLLLGFSLTCFPWCIYMLNQYPNEMSRILKGAASAYTIAVDGHAKPVYYYFMEMLNLFGELILVPLALFVYYGITKKAKFRYWPMLAWILIPLILFSLADTKRFTYLLVSAPAFFIVTGNFIAALNTQGLKRIPAWGRMVLFILLIGLPLRYAVERVKFFGDRPLVSTFYQYSEEEKNLLTANAIVFGTDDYIEIMFHTPVYAAYREMPTNAELLAFQEEGYQVVIAEGNRLLRFNPSSN